MPEGFVALADRLRAASAPAIPAPAFRMREPARDVPTSTPSAACERELVRLRVAAIEALERSVERVLETFARAVLARESLLAPADIARLVEDAAAALRAEEPFAFVVSEADAARIDSAFPVRVDPTLAPGDLIVEVRDGAYESHLAFRLSQAVRAALE